ncbi:hypothetical protein [Rhodoligotrophos defluvii]|uniref:hypothetical protein n=1 Tax=Rhodoligotrophos defluvii TaxID=2561934 RepID=UPI0010CA0384|nr:hypothetical protein [Rhodoligotrophos defluvii]
MFKTFSSQMDEQMEHTFGLLNEKIHDIKQSSLVTGMAAGAGLVGGLGAGTLSGIISAKYILSHVDEPATASDHPQGDISGSAADDPSHLWTVA